MYRRSWWHHYSEDVVNHVPLWPFNIIWGLYLRPSSRCHDSHSHNATGRTSAVTDSFKMADAFVGERTGEVLAKACAQTVGISVWQDRVWMSQRQGMHGLGWRVVMRAKSTIVWSARCWSNSAFVYGDGAVTVRGVCSNIGNLSETISESNHILTITQQTIAHAIVYRSHFELTLVEWNHSLST